MKYVSFLSLLSPLLLKSQLVLPAGTGVRCKVKEERITQDTLQIKMSVLIIASDPSWSRLGF